jgi:hypothetical protein
LEAHPGQAVLGQITATEAAGSQVHKPPLLAKLIPQALLTTPSAAKPSQKGKENVPGATPSVQESSRRSARLASKSKSDLTMEEQATLLLMKKCGTLGSGEEAFVASFVDPLSQGTVKDLRETFDLDEPGSDRLGAVALEAVA